MLVRIANRIDPDQTASSGALWAVGLDLIGRSLVLKFFKHLPYDTVLDTICFYMCALGTSCCFFFFTAKSSIYF